MRRARKTASTQLLMALQSLYIRELAVGGSVCVLRMRDFADVEEMCLGGSPMVVAVDLASVSTSSLLIIPLWPGTLRRAVGTH